MRVYRTRSLEEKRFNFGRRSKVHDVLAVKKRRPKITKSRQGWLSFATVCNKIICASFWAIALFHTIGQIEALWEKYVQYQSIFLIKRGTSGKQC